MPDSDDTGRAAPEQEGAAGAILPFANHLPIRIRFGEGVLSSLPDVLAAEGCSSPFALVDEKLHSQRSVAEVLSRSGGESWVKRSGEPTVEELQEAAARLSAAGADAVVAIGGGATIDTGKAARLVAGQGVAYGRFAAHEAPIEPPSIPLVAVPSTAGSGSEVSGGIVATAATGRKAVVASPLVRAQHALVDPTLTYGLPPAPTMWAGVDALAQAIAATVVAVRTPVGDALGLEAARLAADALPVVVADGSDRAARSRMMCASLLAGLAMNVADAGSEHSLAQALGGRFGLPHGLTVGLVLAESMEHDRKAAPERFERVADALGEPDDGSGDGSRAVRAVQRILAAIGFPTLRSTGAAVHAALASLADDVLGDVFLTRAPAPWARGDVLACYRAALALESR